jgi:predicted metal-binding membrane protein
MSDAVLESIVRRDRVVGVAALALLVAAAWLYLAHFASGMSEISLDDMPGMAMSEMYEWSWIEVAMLAVMWVVMMVAMMMPAATPMILIFAAIHRRRAEQGRPAVPTALFALGYLIVWTAFSVVVALAQSALHAAALLSPNMVAGSSVLAGALLLVAGVFQWTPLKRACLAVCRSPLGFVIQHWREGRAGALGMGVRHGLYCLGCCWALMGLLFVAGVMNLVWVAILAVAVLIEKVAPHGDLVGRIAGVALVVAGLSMLGRPLFAG